MTITRVKMKKMSNSGKLKAVAEVTVDGVLVIHNIKVIDRDGHGNFMITMPSKKRNDKYTDVAHPISPSFRSYFEGVIFDAFYELINSEDTIINKKADNDSMASDQASASMQDKKLFRITSIWLRKMDVNKMKGLVSIVLDAEFAVHDIKLIIDKNTSKRFLAMPCEKRRQNARDQDIVHPVNPELRDQLGQLLFTIMIER